jgi:hypothetical membrane protein
VRIADAQSPRPLRAQPHALWLVIGGYAWLAVTALVGGALHPGYSHVAQFVSELGATGAPNGRFVSLLGFLPAGLLLMLFAGAAMRALAADRVSAAGFALFGVYAFGLFWSAFFSCDYGCRPERPSVSHWLHIGVGMVSYLAGALAPFVVATRARQWSGSVTLPVICVVAGVGVVGSLSQMDPDVAWTGVAQRMLEASMAAWAIACALHLRGARQP